MSAKQSKQSWQVNFQLHDDTPVKPVEEEEISLSEDSLETLRLCHSTSIEFLRHFWLNLQEPSASEKLLKNLFKGLQKSLTRIDSILSAITNPEELHLSTQITTPLKDSLNYAISYYEKLTLDTRQQGELKHK